MRRMQFSSSLVRYALSANAVCSVLRTRSFHRQQYLVIYAVPSGNSSDRSKPSEIFGPLMCNAAENDCSFCIFSQPCIFNSLS